MSDSESTPPPDAPRRSGRQTRKSSQTEPPLPAPRATVKRTGVAGSKPIKSKTKPKRGLNKGSEDESMDSEQSLSGSEEEDLKESDEEDSYSDPSSGEEFGKSANAKNSKSSRARKSHVNDDPDATPKAKGKTGAQKRRARGSRASGKGAGGSTKKPRVSKSGAGNDTATTGGIRKVSANTEVERDSVFFNALIDGRAFEPVIENWAETYEEEQDQALGDLVIFLIRAAGSSSTVTPDEAVDLDGVVSRVDDLEKDKSLGSYPLVSRDRTFKRFRPSLASFISAFVLNLSQTPILYSSTTHKSEPSPMIEVLQSWLFTLSHSPLRSFRHTGTVIALETMSALCIVASEVREELSVASRQREQEKRKAGKATGPAGKAAKERLVELERKVKEVHWKKGKVDGYLNELFNTVFVMRYRDLDPNIRTECVKQLGTWMTTLPDVYLESAYFKYIGWMLDDINATTRLETVRALSVLYSDESHAASLSTFTERFKSRILEMAFHDVELSVRTTSIEILNHIERSGMLEDEKRRQVGLLVFDAEPRVRKAVAGFFEARWMEERDETIEEIEAGRRREKNLSLDEEDDTEESQRVFQTRVGWKSLASMFVRFSQALEDASISPERDPPDDSDAADGAKLVRDLGVGDISGKGRVALAVESLWDKVGSLRDWEGLTEFLCLDHSQKDSQQEASLDSGVAEEGWKLEEEEEGCLLEILVTGLKKTRQEAVRLANEESTVLTDMTRLLINFLPKLIAKYQSDNQHLVFVLAIPLVMNLDMYLDLRITTAYEALWTDLIRLILKNSDLAVLDASISALQAMLATEPLANTNSLKIAELEEALFAALRAIVAGRDVYTAAFTDEEVGSLESCCLRIKLLLGQRDLTEAMDEDEGGNQSNGWAVLLALVSRGTLGYKEERKLVVNALEALARNIFWRTSKALENEALQPTLLEKRSALLELVEECAIGTQSNAVQLVRAAAFDLLLRFHILYNHQPNLTPAERKGVVYTVPKPLQLSLSSEAQAKCADYVRLEIERYIEDRSELVATQKDADESSDDGDSDLDEDETGLSDSKKIARKAKRVKRSRDDDITLTSEAVLVQEHQFISLIAAFVTALKTDVLDIQHASIVFSHYGRFGTEYDILCRSLVDDVRSIACYGEGQQDKIEKLVLQSLENCFELFLDDQIDEATFVSLAKLLTSSLVVYGTQFKILKHVDPKTLTSVHTTLLDTFFRRLGQFQKNGNKSKARKVYSYFRALIPLSVGMQGRDALKIKMYLHEILTKLEIEVTSNKVWDSYRTYEKKLTTTMSKDSRIASGARLQVAQATSDNEDATKKRPAAPSRDVAKRKRTSSRMIDNSDSEPDEADVGKEDDERTKKKARPKPKVRTANRSASSDDEERAGGNEEVFDEEELVMDAPSPASSELSDQDSEPSAGSKLASVPIASENTDVDEEMLDMTQDVEEEEIIVKPGKRTRTKR